MPHDEGESVKKALAALDAMAEAWAEEVDLDRLAAACSNRDKAKALLKQAYIEGLYNGHTSTLDEICRSGIYFRSNS